MDDAISLRVFAHIRLPRRHVNRFLGFFLLLAALSGSVPSIAPVRAGDDSTRKREASQKNAEVRLGFAPTFLRTGQPLEVYVTLPPLHDAIDKAGKNRLTLEFKDAMGKSLAFRKQGAESSFRIWPTESNAARSRYWPEGVYYLHASFDGRPLPNPLRIEIRKANSDVPAPLQDAKLRKRLEAWIQDLTSPENSKREAGYKALKEQGIVALPLIDAALSKETSFETAGRLLRLREQSTNTPSVSGLHVPDGAWLADLDPETWRILQKHSELTEHFRIQHARYAPAVTGSEEEILKLLDHPEPAMRILALRSLPRATKDLTLEKLLACLDDPYAQIGSFSIYPEFPVAREAKDTIAWQGQRVVPHLLRLAQKPRPKSRRVPSTSGFVEIPTGNHPYRREVAEIFGEIGPSKEAAQFLDQMLIRDEADDRAAAVNALWRWGGAGVSKLLDVAQNAKEQAGVRLLATQHLVEVGSADEIGKFLRHLLRIGLADEGSAELAMRAVRRLKFRAAVPELLEILEQKPKTAEEQLRATPLRKAADETLRIIADLPDGVGYDASLGDAQLWRAWWRKNP